VSKEATVERRHRKLADDIWRRSNDPAGLDFGPELLARALASAELEQARATLHDDDYWARVRRCDELEQELADVHALDALACRRGTDLDIPAKIPGFDPGDGSDHLHFVLMPIGPRSRRAAVEYLKKEGKDG
jgi:hypothetical protein